MAVLDQFYQMWAASRGRPDANTTNQLKEAVQFARNPQPEDVAWLLRTLLDDQRKLFVAYLLRLAESFPEPLFEGMMHAAVYELNPSVSRSFVEPCIKAYGQVPVIDRLMKSVRMGTDFEKAGAINALHWTFNEKGQSEMTYRASTDTALDELVSQRRMLVLDTFLESTDVDVQRSAISQLELEPLLYPAQYKERIEKAIQTGRASTDEYVRHRIEVQMGRAKSVYPLPQRRPAGYEAPPQPARKSWWQQLWK